MRFNHRLRELLFALVAALTLPACGAPEEVLLEPGEIAGPIVDGDDAGKADGVGGAPTATYYRVRRDFRRCAYPMCGGLWVRRVNLATTRCADGTYAAECYVVTADYSRLLLSERSLPLFRDRVEGGQGLLRGYVTTTPINGSPWGKLIATEGWQASSVEVEPTGTFRRLQDNGRRCITFPCFAVHAARLNQPYHVNVSEVDLAASGAPQAEADKGLDKLMTTAEGILAAGTLVTVPKAGPAGDGLRFKASQFYFKAGPYRP